MKATLVHKTATQRWYELSEPIHKGICDIMGPIEDITFEALRCLKSLGTELCEEYEHCFASGCHCVCISDAHTHKERLVFPGVYSAQHGFNCLPCNIDGKHTMMSEGGDPTAVYDDEVYLRHLCKLNNLKWEGIENDNLCW